MNDEFTLADALSEIEMFTQVLLETASVRCSALDVGLDALCGVTGCGTIVYQQF